MVTDVYYLLIAAVFNFNCKKNTGGNKMKIIVITFFVILFVLSFTGCAGSGVTDTSIPTSNSEQQNDVPEFHYSGDLYIWDSVYNDYQGGYVLVEGFPWDEYPEELPLVGGYIDFGMGGGMMFGNHVLHVFTAGGDDAEIANWYRQQLELAGWEVTDFEVSEQYGSTNFKLSNDVWYGDFRVESEDASLGGYDGAMPRDESNFEKVAVTISVYAK